MIIILGLLEINISHLYYKCGFFSYGCYKVIVNSYTLCQIQNSNVCMFP